MASHPSPASDRRFDKRLTALRERGGLPLTLAVAAPLAGGVLLVVQAFFLARVLGETIEGGTPLAAMTPLLVVIAALIAVRAGIGILGEQAGQMAAERIKMGLRGALFGHLLARPGSMGVAPASGALSAAIVDQTETLEAFFARYLPAMIAAGFLPVAFAVLFFPIDWIVALLFLLTAPAIPLFMALAGLGAQAATDRQAGALVRLSGHFADRLRGLVTLKLLGRAEAATTEAFEASEELRRRTNAVLRIAFLSSAILEFFAALGVAGVALYVGLTYLGYLPFNPEMTLVAGFFCLLMAPEVYQPLRQLAAHYHDRAAARSALEEIERQIGAVDALARPEPAARSRHTGPAGIAVRDLSVHTENGVPILDRLDFEVAPGETVAVMGESGIGKSTLLRAIAGLVPHEGEIGFPGAPTRPSLTMIAQKPRIFFGTIAGNIGFAAPDASAAVIREAARRARVGVFAAGLPRGLDTPVGEGGEGLSGGEAHRVGLARLFVTDPSIVLLDEPTAHLDPETEALVLDEIFAFARGRTLLLVTHSRVVAQRADRVLRLAGGRLLPVPHRKPDAKSRKEGAA